MSPRRPTRRALLHSLAGGAALLTASPAATQQLVRPPPAGTFRQQGFDARNSAAVPYSGPTGPLEPVWTTHLESVNTVPLLSHNVLLTVSLIDRESRLYGLDPADGTISWSYDVGDAVVGGVLAADNRYVYTAGVVEPRVRALSIRTGTVGWSTTVENLAGGFHGHPRVTTDRVYFRDANGRGIYAFDTESGELREVFSGTFTRFAVDDDYVYGASGSPGADPHGLAVMDVENPASRVVVRTDGRPGRPTVGFDSVFVGTDESTVYAIGRESGGILWTAETDGWPVLLTLAGAQLFAHTNDHLYAFDRWTGRQRYRIPSGTAQPIVGKDGLYVGRERGFAVYDRSSGSRIRVYEPDIEEPIAYLSIIDGAVFVATVHGTLQLVQTQLITE